MRYREVSIWEVLNVPRRIERGEDKSAVARITGHDRETIGRYVATAVERGWRPGTDEPTEALAAAVAVRHSPARDRAPGEVEALLLPHRERVEKWLKPEGPESGQKRGLRLTEVHTLLERQGVAVPYSSLHRFALKHCAFGKGRTHALALCILPHEATFLSPERQPGNRWLNSQRKGTSPLFLHTL